MDCLQPKHSGLKPDSLAADWELFWLNKSSIPWVVGAIFVSSIKPLSHVGSTFLRFVMLVISTGITPRRHKANTRPVVAITYSDLPLIPHGNMTLEGLQCLQ